MSELIPAGDSGEFRITQEMLVERSLDDVEVAEEILLAEARARRLDLLITEEPITRDIIVAWRPTAPGGEQDA